MPVKASIARGTMPQERQAHRTFKDHEDRESDNSHDSPSPYEDVRQSVKPFWWPLQPPTENERKAHSQRNNRQSVEQAGHSSRLAAGIQAFSGDLRLISCSALSAISAVCFRDTDGYGCDAGDGRVAQL